MEENNYSVVEINNATGETKTIESGKSREEALHIAFTKSCENPDYRYTVSKG